MRLDREYSKGFSLIELVITVGVLAILTLGVIPLVQVSVKRQKEQQLREVLRQMREAIDQFHREALAAPPQNQLQQQQDAQASRSQPQQPGVLDPRIRVYISDQTLFTVDNPDRYPPDLNTLKAGVNVMPLNAGGLGKRGDQKYTALEAATEDAATSKMKVYLREIPIDPMTGKSDWDLRSCYQAQDETSWDGLNVFNVHSKSKDTALNGEKYSDW